MEANVEIRAVYAAEATPEGPKLIRQGEVLIAGPGSAKTELVKHIEQHDPTLKKKVVGVETIDHPSDGQLVAHARKYFSAADRMRS